MQEPFITPYKNDCVAIRRVTFGMVIYIINPRDLLFNKERK